MKKNIFVSLIIFLFLLSSGAFYYFYQKNNQKDDNVKLIYNKNTQKWEQFDKEDTLVEDREEILKNIENDNGAYNKTILRGYFETYNEADQTIKIKTIVPFTQSSLFENLNLKLLSNQTIYCAPSIYIDQNNGKKFQTKDLIFPVKDGATLWIPTEKVMSFEDFRNQSNDLTFLYIQLTKDYDKENTNYVKKIIAIGLCE